jgi:chaperonin GroES
MKLKLMPNYLAIKPEDTTTTKSGIVIAETVEGEKPSHGKITHVGGDDNNFSVGQEILFEKYGAFEIKVDQEVLHIIDKRDVIGFVG